MDRKILIEHFGYLKGFKELAFSQYTLAPETKENYNNTVEEISQIIDRDLNKHKIIAQITDHGYSRFLHSEELKNKLIPLLGYLEHGFQLSEEVIEIGSIYNSIADEELKSRCSDILTAPGNFDRVINQATQVLEDRIRNKSNEHTITGEKLINTVMNGDLSKTKLITSQNADEHKGICDICRGLMLAFRNPTHHSLSQKYTREDALKTCAFIDNLLQIIDKSSIKK